jgi:hypothetical protein
MASHRDEDLQQLTSDEWRMAGGERLVSGIGRGRAVSCAEVNGSMDSGLPGVVQERAANMGAYSDTPHCYNTTPVRMATPATSRATPSSVTATMW